MENEKSYTIEDRHVYVFDNMFTSEMVFYWENECKNAFFKRKEYSKDPTKMFYSAEFDIDMIAELPMCKQVVQKIKEKFGVDLQLMRAFINAQTYGDQSETHIDAFDETVTALFYIIPNGDWDKEWGGETIFYENDEPTVMVLPKNNRLVLADARILHCGRTPNRQCHISRYTLSLKYTKEAQK